MAEYTTNLNLKKPTYAEKADIKDINDNMDALDTVIKQAQDDIDAAETDIDSLENGKIDNPDNVAEGKFLQTNENGEAVWGDPFTDEAVETAVDAWMTAHAGADSFTLDPTLTGESSAAQAKAAGDGIKNAMAMSAPVFNASTAYSNGQYVTYDGVLYRLTADHAASTTWANTSKTSVTTGAELSDLKSAFESIYDNNIDTYSPKTEECLQGGFNNIATYNDSSANTNANRLHYLIDVTDYNRLKIAIGTGYSYYFVSYDSSGNIVSRVNDWTTTETNADVSSAKTLRINIKENNGANLNPFMVQDTGIIIVFDGVPYSFSQLISMENTTRNDLIIMGNGWKQGYWSDPDSYSTPLANDNATRIRIEKRVKAKTFTVNAPNTGYKYSYWIFDSNGTKQASSSGWTTEAKSVSIKDIGLIRCAVANSTNSNITPDQFFEAGLAILVDGVDITLSGLTLPVAEELDSFENDYVKDVKHGILFESGTFTGDGVTKSDNTSRIRTASVIDLAEVSSITMPTGYELSAYLLNGSKVKLTQTGYMTSIDFRMANPSAKYANVFLRKSNDTSGDISADVPIINSGVKIVPAYGYTVKLPFDDFAPDLSIIKTQDGYTTDFVPQSKYISISNGVTVFLSENGNDSNNGISVATPKKTLESALSVSNVQTILMLEGTYSAGTHYTAGLTVSQDINIIGLGAVIIDSGNNAPITFTHDLYCENIHFKHGNSNTVIFSANDADTVAVFYKCVFSDSYALNGVRLIGGIGYVVDCVCHDNAYDGFNYHDQNESNTNRSVEIGCSSYNNGKINLDLDEGNTSNATTSHGSCIIIRVNGDYKACHGAIVADQGKYSVNYGCRAGLSTVTDNAYDYRKANYWATQTCEMWLYDCVSYGSKYDAYDANTAVIHSNVAYASVG